MRWYLTFYGEHHHGGVSLEASERPLHGSWPDSTVVAYYSEILMEGVDSYLRNMAKAQQGD